MSRRGNTLEDIGRKALEASVATSTWRRLRGSACERMAGKVDCAGCAACLERRDAYAEHRRAKNSLLVAIRSYIRRTSAPTTL